MLPMLKPRKVLLNKMLSDTFAVMFDSISRPVVTKMIEVQKYWKMMPAMHTTEQMIRSLMLSLITFCTNCNFL